MRIFVTGATGGIGMAVCEELAERGDQLVLTSRSEARLKAATSALREKFDVHVEAHAADLADLQANKQLCLRVRQDDAPFDGCVLIYPRIDKPSQTFACEADWQRNLLHSFVRPLALLEAVADNMHSGGKIVVVSGIAANQVVGHLAMTHAIRSAWLAQAKSLSFALGERGIHINTVSLGGILTERICDKIAKTPAPRHLRDALHREDEFNALGRYGQPRDAARTIATMLTNFVNHLTGINVPCDGGYGRHWS